MRTKKLKLMAALIGVITFYACCLTGCEEAAYNTGINEEIFEQIPSEANLYYDKTTYIVYYIDSEYRTGGASFSYITPYYASNGKPYTYNTVSGRLEETNN